MKNVSTAGANEKMILSAPVMTSWIILVRPVAFLLVAIFCVISPLHAQETKTFQFTIGNGALIEGPDRVRVTQGDHVTMNWRSDKPAEIHLHGYDSLLEVMPGEAASMTVECKATGRFPVTLHQKGGDHSHKPLIYFEVYPK